MTNEQNKYAEKCIGTTRTMHCGLKATIIACRNSRDIDVQFENGAIREHVAMHHFKNGEIIPKPLRTQNENIIKYIGMTRTMNCGLKATIITYRSYDDIDVQFEDGTIREHKSLIAFKRHQIIHESYPQHLINEKYLGKIKTMNCGLKATVISCRNAMDIDVQFEDGTIREHVRASHFIAAHLTHPTNVLFGTYKLNKAAFVFHNKTYFYVTYAKDNCETLDVMCVDDMKQKLPLLTNPNNPEI